MVTDVKTPGIAALAQIASIASPSLSRWSRPLVMSVATTWIGVNASSSWPKVSSRSSSRRRPEDGTR
jgi:hypothetical protein